jgi:hypothetical protein
VGKWQQQAPLSSLVLVLHGIKLRDHALLGGVRWRIARGRSRCAVLPAFQLSLKSLIHTVSG